MDIDMVRILETGNIKWPTSWRRNARRSSSRASMTDSHAMKHSAIEWLTMVETKMFVDNGMVLQMKITHTIWHLKNIIITRGIGGLLQTRQVPVLCLWSTHLTSNKQSTLQQLKQKEEGVLQTSTNSERNQQWAQSSYSFSWWSWQGSWWIPHSYDSHHWDEPSIERTRWLVEQVFGTSFHGLRMQWCFKKHFQLIIFRKLSDWRMEKFCMKNHTHLFDHHQDLIETRSRLDQREWSIGFYSWTTASRVIRSRVLWRSSTCQTFQTNPIQTQTNLWSIGETWGHRTCFCGWRKNVPFSRNRWTAFAQRIWLFR